MKKIFTLVCAATLAATGSQASNVWSLLGTDYQVDTLFHNQVAPGTTQTSLRFHTDAGSGDALRVFYCTMDMTNPYLSLATVCATDKVAGNERISAMAERHSQPGSRYVVGVNGDFFFTSGTTSRGVSTVGTPTGSTVVDGEIYRTRINTTSYKNVLVDTAGQIYTQPFQFGGTVTCNGVTAELGGVNTYSNDASCGNQNKITIYTYRYYGSTNEKSTGCEVQATVASGERFTAGQPCKFIVTGEPSTDGDMVIPDSGYVIRGQGTAASFVQALKAGDEVTVSPEWSYNGQVVVPQQVVTGNPKVLGDGQTLQTEGDRGDANTRQPRAAIGYSDGGKKVYFFVVDGRSSISSGVRTTMLADIMRYAGVTDGINMDGGGSAVLYTSTLGIRNHPSDGTERSDGNGFYAVSSAPDDDQIASLRFVSYSLKMPRYGILTPKFYGYNQYGMLIDQDVQGVKLSCDPAIGQILNDSTFYADGTQTVGMLTGIYQGVSVQMPIQIINDVDGIVITCDTVINDTYRSYAVDVQCTVGDDVMRINPQALSWKSSNPDVCAIDASTGVLRGLKDGTAEVYGTIGNQTDTLVVSVEKPTARVMPVATPLGVTADDFTQLGGKDRVITAVGDGGFDYAYTGASARQARIVLTKDYRLWSLPDTLRLSIDPGEATVKSVTFGLYPNGGKIVYETVTPDSVPAGKVTNLDLPTAAWMDADAMSNYPITLQSVQLNMGTSTTGKEYVLHVRGLSAVYASVAEGIKGDVDGNGVVNANDVTALINLILAGSQPSCGDIDGNWVVNVSDVTALVSQILSQ